MEINKNIKVEFLVNNDLEKIHNLFNIGIKHAYEQQGVGHLTDSIKEDINDKMIMIENYLRGNREYIFFVAKCEDDVIGAVSFGKCGKLIRNLCGEEFYSIGEIGSIYVIPKFHNQGIATKLIDSIIHLLKNNGIQEFCLDSGFKKAQIIWVKKFGKPYKIIKDYWDKDSDHYIWYCKTEEYIKSIK